MSSDYKQALEGLGEGAPLPPIEDLAVLEMMRRGPAMATMRSQDVIAPICRRNVLTSGLKGSPVWRVPNTDPDSASNTHPDRETYYPVAYGKIEVTPGCFYRLYGVAVPSGQTQFEVGMGDYDPDGAIGVVRLLVVWTDQNGNTESTIRERELPPSNQEFGAENPNTGELFSGLIPFEIDEIVPPEVFSDVAELRRWSFHCNAQFLLFHRGSPRIVDCAIAEIPIAYAMNGGIGEANHSFFTQHTYATPTPFAAGPKPTYPYTRNKDTQVDDPRGGTELTLDVARAQALRLGPCLVQWTAYSEQDAGATTTIIPVTRNDDGAGVFKAVFNDSQVGYDETEPGWAMGCGGYARRWAHNNPNVLLDRIAAIPVLVRVFGRVTDGAGTFRFQTALHSYVDVSIAVAEQEAWHTAYGWLEVGITPDQHVVGQALCNHTGGSGQIDVSAFQIYETGYFEAPG